MLVFLMPPVVGVGNSNYNGGIDDAIPLTLWSVAEANVTIMAASLPMMRALVQRFRARLTTQKSDPVTRLASLSSSNSIGPAPAPPLAKIRSDDLTGSSHEKKVEEV